MIGSGPCTDFYTFFEATESHMYVVKNHTASSFKTKNGFQPEFVQYIL